VQIILVISLSYPVALPKMFDPTNGILNKLNNPDKAPFSPSLPCIIGNTLSKDFKNSIILSIFLILPFNHVLFVNRSNLSSNIYQLF